MHPELKQHPEYFSKQIIPLAENVYMAFGFAASNVYMIVGVESVTIIDTQKPQRRHPTFSPSFARSPTSR